MANDADARNRLGAMQLGATFGLFFLVLYLLRHRAEAVFLYLAVGSLVAAVFFYRFLIPVLKVWLRFGNLLNRVIGPLVFGLLFYVFLTPLALLRRLLGGKGLDVGLGPAGQSAWIDRGDKPFAPSEFEKQF